MASKLYGVDATIIIFVFVFYCTQLFCIALHCIVFYSTVFHCNFIVLHCIVLIINRPHVTSTENGPAWKTRKKRLSLTSKRWPNRVKWLVGWWGSGFVGWWGRRGGGGGKGGKGKGVEKRLKK